MCCGKNRQQLQMQMQAAMRKGPSSPASSTVPAPPTAPTLSNGPVARAPRFAAGRPQFFTGPGPVGGLRDRVRQALFPQRGPSPRG